MYCFVALKGLVEYLNNIPHCMLIILQAAIKPAMKTKDLAYETLARCIYTIPSLYAKTQNRRTIL